MVGPLLHPAAVTHQGRLQQTVLGWDYFQMLTQAQKQDNAQRKRKKGEPLPEDGALRPVPSSFSSVAEYVAVYEPLLLEECRAQILRGQDEAGRAAAHRARIAHCEAVNQFTFIKLQVDEQVASDMAENNLVLLCRENPLTSATTPATHALATVEGTEGKQALRLRLHLPEPTPSVAPRVARVRAAVAEAGSLWWVLQLCNLSTITREYTALHSAAALPFLDVILSAKAPAPDGQAPTSGSAQWSIPEALRGHLAGSHNESQLAAVQAGLSRSPVVLIQGPPGTGKTQTILGLLSVVLHASPLAQQAGAAAQLVAREPISEQQKQAAWRAAAPWMHGGNPRDAELPLDGDDGSGYLPSPGGVMKASGQVRRHRAKVLVAAPSNAALDEIVLRLLAAGLRDAAGDPYSPSIVRAGLNAHHSVAAVTMDAIVTQRMASMARGGARAGSTGMERDRIRTAILDEAAIVCSTLSFSGSGAFGRMSRPFDVVIIDEAAQAVEPSTLVALTHGCRQLFLVGDPVQLPATVLSSTAVQYGYATSLFSRLQRAGYPVVMLRTQYRMHPAIRRFPSAQFYAGQLVDGDSVAKQTARPWHAHACFGPFAFLDVAGEEEQAEGSGSYVNKAEVELALMLYRNLAARFPDFKQGAKVAVISPYKHQVMLARERFKAALGADVARSIDINTIDGFQGREKDVAIFSAVRADRKRGIGFVADFRRMNVGITRARASMLVVGCAAALKRDKHWAALIKHAAATGCFFQVSRPFHQFFSDKRLAEIGPYVEPENEEAARLAAGEGDAAEEEGAAGEDEEEHVEELSNAVVLTDEGAEQRVLTADIEHAEVAETSPAEAATTASGVGSAVVRGEASQEPSKPTAQTPVPEPTAKKGRRQKP
ncbi:P-loop containing nucleoside triphosphate hydrolases superfamily protein [Klebsormidium nitens]|uniref:P-loop containing nucleoside triphosphate hydrolases superfamily protein n=1 Tax=Klebsormidium nitens TaxID=105231 RepID=A0A0U9HJB6_KLENI|nr:P-loop containing nucleoside triphosphate hydrolases superfamily protein [Klebsormidium nitens]|eukprot:GAQ80554.1 P-loop containing nucleoside triphosphate hydrolases superfamily protein [Klebsormidium nitens]